MNREEFEIELKDFEEQIKKRLPSMINISLANKGNREQEVAFTHYLETLSRKRKVLMRYQTRVARPSQRVRYFNAAHNMDSQLRSMDNRDAYRKRLSLRRQRYEKTVVYDVGTGPEEGCLINAIDDEVTLKTRRRLNLDQDIRLTVGDVDAKGKASWSIPDENGSVQTGVRLTSVSRELMEELNSLSVESKKNS